ncbi:Glutathione S-transferase theta-2B [Micractinium conductrix]|uniref:Glutathione S-transferase theta-2B n=1 Tax=Micractinium conductrix TaxID=554055 RepID=A0A2P6VN69_9CHLO|nr:Glutathione S-transferase theta-2B [Micractinium conductrix]|eukprot:PSC75495.1 Glutathione S-transferase theta-2B [Micractinium conductrix]
MKDGDFCLPESASIMRHLCDTRRGAVADHWYPAEPHARASINAAMDWHGSTLRVGAMTVVWHRAISLNLGFKGNEGIVNDFALPRVKDALKALDSVWLKDGPFVAGQSQPSIADLLLSCEVEQLCLLDGALQGPDMADLLAPLPRVRAWLGRVRDACSPHYDEVHKLLRKSRDRLVARKQQQASKL